MFSSCGQLVTFLSQCTWTCQAHPRLARVPEPSCALVPSSRSADDLVGAVVEPSNTNISLQLQHPQQQGSLATCSAAIAAAALSSNDGTHGITVSSLHGPGSSRASSSSQRNPQQQGPSLQCLAVASLALAPVDLILTAAAAAAAGSDESSSCGTFSEFLPRCRATLTALHHLLLQQRVQLQVGALGGRVEGSVDAVYVRCMTHPSCMTHPA